MFGMFLFCYLLEIKFAAKNGYYGSLVPMVRDAFLVSELVRIDCTGLERSDYKKIGCKLRVSIIFPFLTFYSEGTGSMVLFNLFYLLTKIYMLSSPLYSITTELSVLAYISAFSIALWFFSVWRELNLLFYIVCFSKPSIKQFAKETKKKEVALGSLHSHIFILEKGFGVPTASMTVLLSMFN